VSLDGQARQELIDRRLAQRQWMLLAMKQDVAPNPGDVGSLCAAGEVHGSSRHADAIEKLRAARGDMNGNASGVVGRFHGLAPVVNKQTPQA
jgi:hypothetical protein